MLDLQNPLCDLSVHFLFGKDWSRLCPIELFHVNTLNYHLCILVRLEAQLREGFAQHNLNLSKVVEHAF